MSRKNRPGSRTHDPRHVGNVDFSRHVKGGGAPADEGGTPPAPEPGGGESQMPVVVGPSRPRPNQDQS